LGGHHHDQQLLAIINPQPSTHYNRSNMATSAGFLFLSLPLELRLQIYGHIADKVPRQTNIAKFSGLYLSCHQIKQEFEGEYMKIFTRSIAKIAGSLSPFRLLLPVLSKFSDAHSLTLQVKHPVCRRWLDYWWLKRVGLTITPPTRPILPNTLDQLFKFKLTSLVICLEEELDGGTSWFCWFLNVLCTELCVRKGVRAQSLCLVAKLDQRASDRFLSDLRGGWELETSSNDGGRMVFWLRRGRAN
jgi:hypothetical protein